MNINKKLNTIFLYELVCIYNIYFESSFLNNEYFNNKNRNKYKKVEMSL